MRTLLLNPVDDAKLLDDACKRLSENREEFIHYARAFLSLLASAKAPDLDRIQADIWPHRLVSNAQSSDSGNRWSASSLYADSAIDVQSHGSLEQRDRSYWRTGYASQHHHTWEGFVDGYGLRYSKIRQDPDINTTDSCITGSEESQHRRVSITASASCAGGLEEVISPYSSSDHLPISELLCPPSWIGEVPSSPLVHSELTPPRDDRELPWPDGTPQSLYAQCIHHLDRLYGGIVNHIPGIIRIGDSMFREDAAVFVKIFCREWSSTELWHRHDLIPPADSYSKVGRAAYDFQRAESLTHSSMLEGFRLRVARILLYHSFEYLCIDIQSRLGTTETLPHGKSAASLAIDKLLGESERLGGTNGSCERSKQQRNRLQKHKSVGKKWSILATVFGLGIFLTCSPAFEAQINKTTFTEKRLAALITYVLNVYPHGSQLSRGLDAFVRCVMQSRPAITWPIADTLHELETYEQTKEEKRYDFDGWQHIDLRDVFFGIIEVA